MAVSEFDKAVEAARVANVRTAIGFLIRDGVLPADIQPTIRLLAEKVVSMADERQVDWEMIFDEVVTGRAISEHDRMGGSDHCDPTLQGKPPWADLVK